MPEHHHLPAPLQVHVAHPGSGPDGAFHRHQAVRFLTGWFGAVAAAVWRHNGGLKEVSAPAGPDAWRLLLGRAVSALKRRKKSEHAADLLAVFAGGAHKKWLAAGGDDDPAVLSDWLEAAQPFFAIWQVEGASCLAGPDGTINLSPYLLISDCPDCDGTDHWFLLAGVRPDGRGTYRNLMNGHVVAFPDTAEVCPAEPQPLQNLSPDFAGDDHRVVPEAWLSRVRRMVTESPKGYALVSGPDGIGKTWLSHCIVSDGRFEAAGVAVARVEATAAARPAAVWLQEFDQALRQRSARFRLPAPEFARGMAEAPPEVALSSYLASLVQLNGGPVLVVVDDVAAWPQSAPFWPTELPHGVFVVLTAPAGGLDTSLKTRLDRLAETGAMTLRLTSQEPTVVDIVGRLGGTPGRDATPLSCRTGASLEAMEAALGRAAMGHDVLPVLIRLAAAGGQMPRTVLEDQVGSEGLGLAVHQAARWLVQRGRDLALVHPSVLSTLRNLWPEAWRSTCRQLVWWATDTLQHQDETPHTRVAEAGLWRWIREGGVAPGLSVRALWAGALERMERPALDRLPLVSNWQTALGATVPVQELAEAGLRRVELLSELGAWADAGQAAGPLVARLQEAIRDGRADLRPLLARSLVLRADASLHREMAAAAVDDCKQALEIYELEDKNKVDLAQVAQARWVMGKALAGTEGAVSAVLPLEQALSLYSTAGGAQLPDVFADLAAAYLRTGQTTDAEVCCTLALEHLEGAGEAACLARRSHARSLLGRDDDARGDIEVAVLRYHTLLEAGRFELAAEAAQAYYDLGSMTRRMEPVSRSIELGHLVVDVQGQSGARPLLARAYNERGLQRSRQGQLQDSVADFTAAIDMGTVMLERERRSGLRGDLAQACNNRALAWTRLGDPARAQKDYHQAVIHYEALVVKQRRNEFRQHLALVHFNRGGLHRAAFDLEAARRDYSRAADLLSDVLRDQDRADVRRDLAAVLVNRGLAAGMAGEGVQAVGDGSNAISILADLMEAGWQAVATDLAAAYHGRGMTQARLRAWPEAVSDLGLAVTIAGDDAALSSVFLMDRGEASLSLFRAEAAAADFQKAVHLCGPDPFAQAPALVGLGRALMALKQADAAREVLDRAVQGLEGVPEAARNGAWLERLALAKAARAEVTGLHDLDEAVRLAELAVQQQEAGSWALAVRNRRARMLVKLKMWSDAVEDVATTLVLLPRLALERDEADRLRAEAMMLRGRAFQGLEQFT
ncbi:MAG TPA: tetratricopeptide repeat protein, partial [Candidatus Xenobia bacterium]